MSRNQLKARLRYAVHETIQALPGSPISLGPINQMPEDEAQQELILPNGPANNAIIFQLNIFWSNGRESTDGRNKQVQETFQALPGSPFSLGLINCSKPKNCPFCYNYYYFSALPQTPKGRWGQNF